MRLMIWTRDQGITDDTYKDGDIFQVWPDTWAPGTMETKRWLVVQMPDYGGSWDELVAGEYQMSASSEPQIRRMRKYRLNYAPKLTPEELALAKDREGDLPVIEGRFTINDIVRK